MAEGGKVSHYCDSDRQHLQACEYYAEGGQAPQFDDIQEAQPQQPPQAPVIQGSPTPTPAAPQFDDIKDVNQAAPKFDDIEDVKPQDARAAKYGTPDQQLLAGLEGAGQGLGGPLFTGAEKGLNALGVPGLTPEDIKGRADENPGTHGIAEVGAMGAGLMTGAGIPGLIAKGAEAIAPAVLKESPALLKLGSAAIRGGMELGGLQTSDEVSKGIMNDDPTNTVGKALANIAWSTVLGTMTGGLFNVLGQGAETGLQKLDNSKMADTAKKMLAGSAIANRMNQLGIPIEEAESFIGNSKDYKDLKPGIDAYNKILSNTSGGVGRGVGGAIGATVGSVAGTAGTIAGERAGEHIGKQIFTPMIEKIINKTLNKGNEYIYPAVVKSLVEGNTEGLFQAIDYANKVSKGAKAMTNSVEALFKPGVNKVFDYDESKSLVQRDKLDKAIEDGGVVKQIQDAPQEPQFAEGGKVEAPAFQDHFSSIFPNQAAAMANAKSRVYNYLNQNRPQKPINQLPFDTARENMTAKRSYHRALDIANTPLSVLNNVKDGSITPEQVQHLSQLHPEIYKDLSDKIMSKVVDHKMADTKPDFKLRQGLSIFLGQPLESSMTPFNIMAAQSTFAPKQGPQQPQQGANKAKKGTAPLSKVSSSYMTKDQHREDRQNKT